MVLEDVGRTVICPTPVIIDSKATRDVVIKPGASKRTRYFERTTMLIKHLFMLDKIVPLLIKTEEMVADILTKATPKEIFYKMRSYMLNSKESGDASALRARLLAQLAKLSR